MSACVFSITAVKPADAFSLISAANVGSTSATSNAGAVVHNVSAQGAVPLLVINAKVTNNGVAPGASKNVTVYYAFCDELLTDLTATGAPLQFEGNSESSLVVALQNSASVVQRNVTAQVPIRGKYLYVWYDISALAVSAAVTIAVSVTHLG